MTGCVMLHGSLLRVLGNACVCFVCALLCNVVCVATMPISLCVC